MINLNYIENIPNVLAAKETNQNSELQAKYVQNCFYSLFRSIFRFIKGFKWGFFHYLGRFKRT